MKSNRFLAIVVGLGAAAMPVVALGQSVNATRSVLPDQPYTLIYPDAMIAVGGGGSPLTINHPDIPLQCNLSIVPVEDTTWTAESAISSLDAGAVTAAWAESFPDFELGESGTVEYQDATALSYEGTSAESPMGMPITLAHTETVVSGRGYSLDCVYSTAAADQIRPIVDFIFANFATRSDAECCIGATAETEPAPAQ